MAGLMIATELAQRRLIQRNQDIAQLLGYLRASRKEHGLLINFGAPKLEIRKYALSQDLDSNL